MFIKNIIFLLLFFLIICNVKAQLVLNKTCKIEEKCKPLKDCSSLQQNKNNTTKPEICRIQENVPFICCPVETSKTGEIAEQKCKEYGQSVFEKLPLNNEELPIKSALNISKCKSEIISLIPSSSYATKGEFPHMALLGFEQDANKVWVCAGSLISDRYVLTAAHCVHLRGRGNVKYIRLGVYDTKATNDTNIQDYNVAEIIVYPTFKPPSPYNDIALLKMDKPVQFNEYIRPACLHTSTNIPSNRFFVSSWTESYSYLNQFNILQKKISQEVPLKECNYVFENLFKSSSLKHRIDPNTQICADDKLEEKDCESIFSGAPLQIKHPDVYCMYSIVGVSSFGKQCGSVQTVDVYTRVSHYIEWIEKTIWL